MRYQIVTSIPANLVIKKIEISLSHPTIFQIFSHLNYIFFNLAVVQDRVVVLVRYDVLKMLILGGIFYIKLKRNVIVFVCLVNAQLCIVYVV